MNSWARAAETMAFQPFSHNETDSNGAAEEEQMATEGYTSTMAVTIVALCAAAVFVLMIVVIFIMNEKNSKQINKAMLVSEV